MQAALGALVKTPPPPSQRLDQELEPEMKMKTVQAGGGESGLRGLSATSSSSSPFSQQVVTSSNNQVNFLDESLAPMRAEAVALINDLMTGIIEANYTLIDPGRRQMGGEECYGWLKSLFLFTTLQYFCPLFNHHNNFIV
jgi:hypothetical protein